MKQSPPSEQDPFAALKQGVRWMWSLGDYTALAQLLQPYAERLAEQVDLRQGMDVLDVAAGNGNFALAAAARGAHVVASDLTPAMIELGRARSDAAGLSVDWREGDAEALPFDNDSFDVVASVFGAMFAPRPNQVAAELFRVARPGGIVAMANYSESGFLGSFGRLLSRYSQPPSLALPSPFSWGDETEVRRRIEGFASSIELRSGVITFRFASLDEGLAFWERTNPPQIALRSILPAEAYASFREEARDLMGSLNSGSGSALVLDSGYLSVAARKLAVDQQAPQTPSLR